MTSGHIPIHEVAISLKLLVLVLVIGGTIDNKAILIPRSIHLFIILALASLRLPLHHLSYIVSYVEPRISTKVLHTRGRRHGHLVRLRAPEFFVD